MFNQLHVVVSQSHWIFVNIHVACVQGREQGHAQQPQLIKNWKKNSKHESSQWICFESWINMLCIKSEAWFKSLVYVCNENTRFHGNTVAHIT